jgi:hypothetical protein
MVAVGLGKAKRGIGSNREEERKRGRGKDGGHEITGRRPDRKMNGQREAAHRGWRDAGGSSIKRGRRNE